MEKKCLECGETFQGRIDKKFCSDQCRNTYNNRLNSDSTNKIRNINNILRKNHRILKKLNPKGKSKVHKAKLASKGFNFNYITNFYNTKNNKTYYFCYDQGYFEIEDDYYVIVEKEEYIDKDIDLI
ncbi:MAG: hypothetical protein JXB17_10690 [Bacteroidales bacterium]|nr:hypothetical protein [Bacteroidales bacterium]